MRPAVSDETLHAFVDGELDVAESETLIARMRDEDDLAQRVCTLRSLQSMVRLAYAKAPVPGPRSAETRPRRLLRRCSFGCLVLFAGVSGGWALRGLELQAVAAVQPAATPDSYQMVSVSGEADPSRVMLHLESGSPEKMQVVLDQAEDLLDKADREGRSMQIEILANGRGIDMLRAGYSPYAERIARMKLRHANLQWVACSQSIARFTGEGQTVNLLPAARTAPTAIGEIVTRLQQGWTYVRV